MCCAYLSKGAYEELKEKLDYLKTKKRKEISKAIEEARLQGDLRENAGYHEAKKDQSLNEIRIAEMEEDFRHAEVMEEDNSPKDFVDLGSKVKIKNLDSGEEKDCIIVSEAEADFKKKKISDSSPVGRKLLGRGLGEEVSIEVPMGTIRYKILEIS